MTDSGFARALKAIEKDVKNLEGYDFEIKPSSDEKSIYLMNPWNDKSVALVAYDSGKRTRNIFKLLGRLILPNELSGIYHKSEGKLEIVWTAYRLGENSEQVRDRKFQFIFRDKSYNCSFSKSSDDLLELAKNAAYLQISETGFRNLQSFSAYTNDEAQSDKAFSQRLGTPISFFIENLSGEHGEWFEVIKHLNFYLKYYDAECPHIIVHDNEQQNKHPKKRYIEGSFPEKILSRDLNPTLLAFWSAAYDHDITTRFLLYYRILEYVAGSYIQAQQRQELLKILSSPTAQSTLDKTLDRVAEVVRQDKLNEYDRFERMFVDLVAREKVWEEIRLNEAAFTSRNEFDGGLTIEPLVKDISLDDAFDINSMKSLAGTLRKIRHALAHGGEQQTGNLILPTNRNFDMLLPWSHLAMVAAGEALLYEHLG